MTRHRLSYWKTAAVSALLAATGLAAMAWLVAERFLVEKTRTEFEELAWWADSLALLCIETAIVFVLAGALISLHRDRLETLGVPYGLGPREWRGGFAARGLRLLLRGLRALRGRRQGQLDLGAGDLVEIRSLEEILATLDDHGELDSLPFMPEMEAWCGRQTRVFRRVDKIFDWITLTGLRRMQDTVILEGLRCDGSAHNGCQADCALLWKEAWLRRVSDKRTTQVAPAVGSAPRLDVRQFTTRTDPATGETCFVCQLSRLPNATTPTSWNNPRNLLRELLSGNVRPGRLFAFVAILLFNTVQRRVGGVRFPVLASAQLQKTPHAALDLRPGELVRIKGKHEIEQTLNAQFKNRGLWFDKEMTRFCGGTYSVRARVDHQIDEKTGKMAVFTTPCITLEQVTATGEYFEFAPLDERIYWREIWLDRMTAKDTQDPRSSG